MEHIEILSIAPFMSQLNLLSRFQFDIEKKPLNPADFINHLKGVEILYIPSQVLYLPSWCDFLTSLPKTIKEKFRIQCTLGLELRDRLSVVESLLLSGIYFDFLLDRCPNPGEIEKLTSFDSQIQYTYCPNKIYDFLTEFRRWQQLKNKNFKIYFHSKRKSVDALYSTDEIEIFKQDFGLESFLISYSFQKNIVESTVETSNVWRLIDRLLSSPLRWLAIFSHHKLVQKYIPLMIINFYWEIRRFYGHVYRRHIFAPACQLFIQVYNPVTDFYWKTIHSTFPLFYWKIIHSTIPPFYWAFRHFLNDVGPMTVHLFWRSIHLCGHAPSHAIFFPIRKIYWFLIFQFEKRTRLGKHDETFRNYPHS